MSRNFPKMPMHRQFLGNFPESVGRGVAWGLQSDVAQRQNKILTCDVDQNDPTIMPDSLVEYLLFE